MQFRILGPLEVVDGDSVVPLAGVKQRALLALLLLNVNEVVSSDRLIEACERIARFVEGRGERGDVALSGLSG